MSSLYSLLKKEHESKGYPLDVESPDMKIYMRAYEEWKRRKFLRIINQEYQLGLINPQLKTIEDANALKIKNKKAISRKDTHIFLTVSPPDEYFSKKKGSPLDFIKLIQKQCERKFVKDYEFCIEQRGMTKKEIGKGIHAHILFKRDLNFKPGIIKRDLRNGLSKVYLKAKVLDYNFNFKKCGTEFAELRRAYMRGEKNDEKDAKCKMDPHFRKRWGIKDIYSNQIKFDHVQGPPLKKKKIYKIKNHLISGKLL